VRSLLSTFRCGLDRGVFTFLNLEDRAFRLRRSQRPFHVVAVAPAFRQSVSVSDWFEIKTIDQFLLCLHIDRVESDFGESGSIRLDFVAAGNNLRDEVAVSISRRMFDQLRAFPRLYSHQ